MFALFLLPFAIRNEPLFYEWVFYRALDQLQELKFLGPADYVSSFETRCAAGAFATLPEAQSLCGYKLPSADTVASVHVTPIEADVLQEVTARFLGPNQIWSTTILERIPSLEQAISEALSSDSFKPEALLLWVNCPSAKAAAGALGIPTIHNELGPLREPDFRATAYFDFEGVNGGSSASARWRAFRAEKADVPVLSRTDLLAMFELRPPEPQNYPRYIGGVALQVGSDSNLIAFGRGFTNLEAIYTARRFWEKILVRSHPAMTERYEQAGVEWDVAPTAGAFLSRIDHLLTINSSLALEAMLRGVPVSILGDSPFAMGTVDLRTGVPILGDDDWIKWLNWMLFGYLIPYARLFDRDYYRWRLQYPSEADIYRDNYAFWRNANPS